MTDRGAEGEAPGGKREEVAGLILAGGQSRRMGGGDKALRPLGGRPLLAHIIERAASQVGPLLLNANGDPARFCDAGLANLPPVAADVVAGHAGPLAGILTGLVWTAEKAPQCGWMASFACDAPFFPTDLVARLHSVALAEKASLAAACSRGRSHPVFGLWRVDLRDDLRRAVEDGVRKVDVWTARHDLVLVNFPDMPTNQGAIDPFFNANRPDDLAAAEEILEGL
ncbi:MAG: molybdenum cofactor guanylyltransferase MobA [Pseudomonadota bacterium]